MPFNFEDFLSNFDYNGKHDSVINLAMQYLFEVGDPKSLSKQDFEFISALQQMALTKNLDCKKLENLPELETPIFQIAVRDLLLHGYLCII